MIGGEPLELFAGILAVAIGAMVLTDVWQTQALFGARSYRISQT